MPFFSPPAWQDHHALACEGQNISSHFPLFSTRFSFFIICPPTLATLSLSDVTTVASMSNILWHERVEALASVARKLLLYYLALGGCVAVGQQNRRTARHFYYAQAVYGRGCPSVRAPTEAIFLAGCFLYSRFLPLVAMSPRSKLIREGIEPHPVLSLAQVRFVPLPDPVPLLPNSSERAL